MLILTAISGLNHLLRVKKSTQHLYTAWINTESLNSSAKAFVRLLHLISSLPALLEKELVGTSLHGNKNVDNTEFPNALFHILNPQSVLSLWNLTFFWMVRVLKHSFPTLQSRYWVSVTKTNPSMLLREIIAVYCENRTKSVHNSTDKMQTF
jgi:hypothetical protein